MSLGLAPAPASYTLKKVSGFPIPAGMSLTKLGTGKLLTVYVIWHSLYLKR